MVELVRSWPNERRAAHYRQQAGNFATWLKRNHPASSATICSRSRSNMTIWARNLLSHSHCYNQTDPLPAHSKRSGREIVIPGPIDVSATKTKVRCQLGARSEFIGDNLNER